MKELYNPMAAARFILETPSRERRLTGKLDVLPLEAGLKIGTKIYIERFKAFGLGIYWGIIGLLLTYESIYLLERFVLSH